MSGRGNAVRAVAVMTWNNIYGWPPGVQCFCFHAAGHYQCRVGAWSVQGLRSIGADPASLPMQSAVLCKSCVEHLPLR